MEQLPSELIDYLCTFLSNAILKSLRLTCQRFAIVGESHLFREFEFRLSPNHHRLYQLERLTSHPSISKNLKTLSFESGIQLEYADYRYWQTNTYQDIVKQWKRSFSDAVVPQRQYEHFHGALQARFTPDMAVRYELLRWHLDQEAEMVAKKATRNTLRRILNTLRERVDHLIFKIVMAEPHISLEDLEAFNPSLYKHEFPIDTAPRRRVLNRRVSCVNHFINFIEAINMSKFEMRDFIAIDVPSQLLVVDAINGAETLHKAFQPLTSLDMRVSQFPLSDWLSRGDDTDMIYFGDRGLAPRRLGELLDLTTHLESLKLEFPIGKEAKFSFDLFDRSDLDVSPRFWLPHLRVLNLRRFQCTWQDLQALLRAAKKVRSLTLSHCRLESGSMLDLINFLPRMQLEHICIGGKWQVNQDVGEWHSHTDSDFTDCFAATSYEGPYMTGGIRRRIHHFMLHGGQCPLPTLTPGGSERETWEMDGDTSWHYIPTGLRG